MKATKRTRRRLCACGCNEYAKPGNKFIYQHHVRGEGNPHYGKKGKLSFNYGRKHTELEKQKMSDSKKSGKESKLES